ncbi:acyclic terpene utilization AtuA family protein [Nocardioides sp.]|uniref:acyclic terpene utilization AtuA family protein n=1 Tax=Nocardioides sp. TaxID=35761 RepID=UPI002ED5C645
MSAAPRTALRIGNCSGFYGDRHTAMREMLEGGRLDVLTGDYLAELTMLILGKDLLKDPSLGYARSFVRQLEECLGTALERGVQIVSNAGGLNPAGLAEKVREVARGLGLDPAVAHVEGDDLKTHGFPGALTANAYLGGFGIAAALTAGADVVVTGRVTDASLVVGPAVAHHGWTAEQYDELAGAVVTGHVLECGAQATGGNFSGFRSLPEAARSRPLGFPLAEIAADGSSVITKHEGTGGAVTLDTVTAQLLYEVQSTRYLGPDVTVDLASVRLADAGPDRVAIAGVRGEPPPELLKVCVNELGGYRNSVELVLTGLDVEEKAAWARSQLEAALDPAPATVVWSPVSQPEPDASTEEAASVVLRCTVQDPSPDPVGRSFTATVVELALASYPGFTMTAPPAPPSPYGVFRAEYVERSAVTHTVVHADGRRQVVPEAAVWTQTATTRRPEAPSVPNPGHDTLTRRLPLGTFVHARSGDKGGDANLGLWVSHTEPDKYDARVQWLSKLITPTRIRELVPEAADLDIEVHQLPNLGGVNVLLRGLLGRGVAASSRFDPQAKGLGEWVRSRLVSIEEDLV